MEELKFCKSCQEWKPKTTEHFYCWIPKDRPHIRQWCTYCRKCDSKRVVATQMKKYVHKRDLPKPSEILRDKEIEANKERLHHCRICEQDLPVNESYWYFSHSKGYFELHQCRECRRELSRHWHASGDTYEKPGQFETEEEKQEVWDFLKKMGWKYCESTKTWFKRGIKNRFNKWDKIHKRIRKKNGKEN